MLPDMPAAGRRLHNAWLSLSLGILAVTAGYYREWFVSAPTLDFAVFIAIHALALFGCLLALAALLRHERPVVVVWSILALNAGTIVVLFLHGR
jgi:hypothetical protein